MPRGIDCFAMNEGNRTGCNALRGTDARRMYALHKCGTMLCPMYKRNRSDRRLGDKILDMNGEDVTPKW